MINQTYNVTHEGLLDVVSGRCRLSALSAKMINVNLGDRIKYEIFKGDLFYGAWVIVELVMDDSSEDGEPIGFKHKVIKEHTQAMNNIVATCDDCEKCTAQSVSRWFDEEQTKPSISHCMECGTKTIHKSNWFNDLVTRLIKFITTWPISNKTHNSNFTARKPVTK